MNYTAFKFSTLLSAAYSMEQKILEIMFADGSTQQYADVPSTTYFSLINAYSHDRYFENYIKSIFNPVQ